MPAEPQLKPDPSVTITVRGVGAGVLLDVEPPEITSVGTAPAGPARMAAMTRAASTAVMMRVARMALSLVVGTAWCGRCQDDRRRRSSAAHSRPFRTHERGCLRPRSWTTVRSGDLSVLFRLLGPLEVSDGD